MLSINRSDNFTILHAEKAKISLKNYNDAQLLKNRCEFSVRKLVGVHILVAMQSKKVFQTGEATKTINIHPSCFIKKNLQFFFLSKALSDF